MKNPESKKIWWAKFWTLIPFILAGVFVFFAGMKWATEPFVALADVLIAMMNWNFYKGHRRELDELLEHRAVKKRLDKRDSEKSGTPNASKPA